MEEQFRLEKIEHDKRLKKAGNKKDNSKFAQYSIMQNAQTC